MGGVQGSSWSDSCAAAKRLAKSSSRGASAIRNGAGRPLLFDRFYASQLGGKAVDLLLEGRNNVVATLQLDRQRGFHLGYFEGNGFRDRCGHIHARQLHPSFYDAHTMKPSRAGIEYLQQILTGAIGEDDMESVRTTLFASGKLLEPYHSLNVDVHKRIRYLEPSDK